MFSHPLAFSSFLYNGKRKFILMELGRHFETALVPRMKKIGFSLSWKEELEKDTNKGSIEGSIIRRSLPKGDVRALL